MICVDAHTQERFKARMVRRAFPTDWTCGKGGTVHTAEWHKQSTLHAQMRDRQTDGQTEDEQAGRRTDRTEIERDGSSTGESGTSLL